MAQQGSGPQPPRPGPYPAPRAGQRPGRGAPDAGDELPPWTDLGPPARAPRAGRARPGKEHAGRVQAARARRIRHRIQIWAAIAVVAGLAAVLAVALRPGRGSPRAQAGGFVSTFQPGEYRTIPGACGSVSAGTLDSYLPGKRSMVTLPALAGGSGSQCDWTLDAKPVYRLLEVSATAYAPSGLVPGNGSATSVAEYAYRQALQTKQHPPRETRQPAARITALTGLGAAAFSAYQVLSVGGDITDRVTVVARLRNVLVTVQFSGLAHAAKGGYGPVSPADLAAGAAAAARNVLARIR